MIGFSKPELAIAARPGGIVEGRLFPDGSLIGSVVDVFPGRSLREKSEWHLASRVNPGRGRKLPAGQARITAISGVVDRTCFREDIRSEAWSNQAASGQELRCFHGIPVTLLSQLIEQSVRPLRPEHFRHTIPFGLPFAIAVPGGAACPAWLPTCAFARQWRGHHKIPVSC